MDFIKEWITNIILFVLLATVIDMLLPNTNMKKYTKMVTGLLLIAVILTPVLKLLSHDFEETFAKSAVFEVSGENKMENLIELQKKEIQASNHAYILEQMAVQIKEDTKEELMDQYGLEITNIDFVADERNMQDFPDNLQKVMVELRHKDEDTETAIEAVKTVEINTSESHSPDTAKTEDAEKAASLLAQKLNVDEKMIEVQVEGGKMNSDG